MRHKKCDCHDCLKDQGLKGFYIALVLALFVCVVALALIACGFPIGGER